MSKKPSSKPMTAADVARIQSATAKQSGGGVSKDSFVARAQRTVAKKDSEQALQESGPCALSIVAGEYDETSKQR